jgi:hypothetical protein
MIRLSSISRFHWALSWSRWWSACSYQSEKIMFILFILYRPIYTTQLLPKTVACNLLTPWVVTHLQQGRYLHSVTQVVSRLHATILGKGCVVEMLWLENKFRIERCRSIFLSSYRCQHFGSYMNTICTTSELHILIRTLSCFSRTMQLRILLRLSCQLRCELLQRRILYFPSGPQLVSEMYPVRMCTAKDNVIYNVQFSN